MQMKGIQLRIWA